MRDESAVWVDEGLELLDEDQCLHLMGTVPVGRVAVSSGAVPAVFPVTFALYGRRIVFRTGQGTKLDAAVRHATVAFEVDQFDALYHDGWSVLAVGRADDITDNLELIGGDRGARPWPWVGGERDHYVAIEAELLTGRRIPQRSRPAPKPGCEIREMPDGGREFHLLVRQLTWVRVDEQVRLQFGQAELAIASPFSLRRGDDLFALDPEDRAQLGPLLALWPDTLVRMSMSRDGTLEVAFASGAFLTVSPDQRVESWNVDGFSCPAGGFT